jgi:hypothetical protein
MAGVGGEDREPWAAPGSSGPDQEAGKPPEVPGRSLESPVVYALASPVRHSRAWLVLLVGGVVAVSVVVALVVIGVVGNDSAGDGELAEADPADAETVVVPGDYRGASVDGLRLRLPPSWVWVGLNQDIEGVGEQLAPDDPALARDLVERMRGMPRSAVLAGFDKEDLNLEPGNYNTGFVLVKLGDDRPAGVDELRESVIGDFPTEGFEMSSVSYLASGEGPALRVRYRMSRQFDAEGLQYWYATSDGPYTLSFTSDDLDDYVDVPDAIASSLVLD